MSSVSESAANTAPFGAEAKVVDIAPQGCNFSEPVVVCDEAPPPRVELKELIRDDVDWRVSELYHGWVGS